MDEKDAWIRDHNERVVQHFIRTLRESRPDITEQEIEEAVTRMKHQAARLWKAQADLLITGHAALDLPALWDGKPL